jgi:predicted Zn-dependent protease with MMP-like domain
MAPFMDDKEFLNLVDAGISALPQKIKSLMQNVAVVIADDILADQRKEMDLEESEIVFGLYEGVPQTERGVDYQALPDKITIFKNPILETYTDPQDIKECVENTVWHEVAHHFGYGDPWIEKEEETRGKIK